MNNPFDPNYGQAAGMQNVNGSSFNPVSPMASATQGFDPKGPAGGGAAAPLGSARNPSNVQLPPHIFIPPNHTSVDFRAVASVPAGTTRDILWQYKVPAGKVLQFVSYGIFNDGDGETDFDFSPEVNGARVFAYHGNPGITLQEVTAHMALGLAPDLSANSLIQCQLVLNPGDVITWYVTNRAAVAAIMGARMVGYFLKVAAQGKVGG